MRPFIILNLSDLHINAEEINQSRIRTLNTLKRDLSDYNYNNQEENWLPDFIALPGDIINIKQHKPAESYTKASEILNGFLSFFGNLPKERIIAVPGNHDKKLIEEFKVKNPICLRLLKKKYENLKVNFGQIRSFDRFSSQDKIKQIHDDFISFHQDDFVLFSNFNRHYNQEQGKESFNYYTYSYFKDTPLEYVSGLKVFKDQKVCFLCLNTEWLSTRGEIEPKLEIHLCTPIVKELISKLTNIQDFAHYTVVTLMHRKPDDLSWKTKNHSDVIKCDALNLIEQHTDILLSGHEHSIRTKKPDMIKNIIQHLRLGSASCPTGDTENFPYSVSVIKIDPFNRNFKLLVGSYNVNEQWEFKNEGTFLLRNKFALSTDFKKTGKRTDLFDPIRLKAPSKLRDDIKQTIQKYFGENDLTLVVCNVEEFDKYMPPPKIPTHLILYTNNAEDVEIRYMKSVFDVFSNRVEIVKAMLLRQLVTSMVVFDIPRFGN